MPLGLERIDWRTRRYLFMGVTILSSLYLFEPTNKLIEWVFDYKIEEFPFLSVKNIVGFLLFVLFIALKFNQVD